MGTGVDTRFGQKLVGVCQGLNSEEKFAGAGAGLALAEQIVQLHGGMDRADFEVDRGATFHLSLPIAQEQPA